MKIQNEPIDWHLSIGHETNKRIKVEKNKSNTYLITILPRSPSKGMPKAKRQFILRPLTPFGSGRWTIPPPGTSP